MTGSPAQARTKQATGLPETMQTAILYGQRDVRIERSPVPCPGAGEVLLAVKAALTDGTDLKVFRRGYHARMIVPPAPFGHEFAGLIAEVGAGVTDWRVGDRVVAGNSASCGKCFHCVRSQESLCDDLVFVNGAYAEYLLLPARIVSVNLLAVPPDVPFHLAAFTEPLACVLKGVRDLGASAGETVAVIGSGAIGLMAARVLALRGAGVLLFGRRHLDRAAAPGVEIIETPADTGALADRIRSAAPGRGPDRVFEATGVPAVWEQAIASVRKGGTVNLFGGCPAGTRVSFDTNRVHYDEITIRSSFHHTPFDVRAAHHLITSGKINLEPLLDGEEPLARLPSVLAEMDERKRTLKTVIRPGGIGTG